MKNTVWTYWENPKGVSDEPAYITLCRWTMLHNLHSSTLVAVNPENLDKYLPGMTSRLEGVQAHARGRLDKAKRIVKGDTRSLAIKCDVIRAHLLKLYGGFYIDSDAIVLNDLKPYFDLLDQYEFAIVKRASHGKSHVSVNFYGSRPFGELISRYTAAQTDAISRRKIFDFTGLGDTTLNPIVDDHQDGIYYIPEREVQAVTYEESEAMLLSRDLTPEDVIKGNESVFMLYKGIFQNQLKGISLQDLYYGDMLVSRVYRRALPEEKFKQYLNSAF
ncbi:MAG: hypothetical protein CMK32_14215 [Porticoccaceae bacterium]|nr:hypothetical protein [Porticoccaceae bacterium]